MNNAGRFLMNAVIMTATSLVISAVGVWFNLFISNRIGVAAMGVFQLILSVYSLAVTVATSGINLTATRLVAEEIGGDKRDSVPDAMHKCILYGLCFGVAAAAALFLLGGVIGTYWINEPLTVRPLRLAALSLPFTSVSCALGGYFTAVRRVAKNSAVQISDQGIKIVLTVLGLTALVSQDDLEGTCLVMIGATAVSEFLACIGSYVLYQMDRRRLVPTATVKDPTLTKRMFYIGLPIALSSYLRSGLLTLKNLLVPGRLKKNGMTQENAHAVFGTVHGVVLPAVLFPSVFLSAFCSLIIPELTESHSRIGGGSVEEDRHIHYMVNRMFQVAYIFSIGAAGAMFFFSEEIAAFVSNNANIPFYLRLFAPLIPIMYVDTAVDSMLKGLNEQMSSMKYNIIDACVSVMMVWFVLPHTGLKGYIATIFLSEILNGAMSLNRLIKVVKLRFELRRWVLFPLLSVMLSGAVVVGLRQLTALSGQLWTVVLAAVFLAAYLLLLIATHSVTTDDLRWGMRLITGRKKAGHTDMPVQSADIAQ